MIVELEENIAFVDSQNLHFGTTKCNFCALKNNILYSDIKKQDCVCGFAWNIDLERFKVYLFEKYNITKIYYFMGYFLEKNSELYNKLRISGYVLVFKEHLFQSKSNKKGNVDVDIVYEVLKNVIENKHLKSVIIVSGDGDYFKLVNYLINKRLFKKILFPNKKYASSLYKKLGSEFFDYMENIKNIIATNEKGS